MPVAAEDEVQVFGGRPIDGENSSGKALPEFALWYDGQHYDFVKPKTGTDVPEAIKRAAIAHSLAKENIGEVVRGLLRTAVARTKLPELC